MNFESPEDAKRVGDDEGSYSTALILLVLSDSIF